MTDHSDPKLPLDPDVLFQHWSSRRFETVMHDVTERWEHTDQDEVFECLMSGWAMRKWFEDRKISPVLPEPPRFDEQGVIVSTTRHDILQLKVRSLCRILSNLGLLILFDLKAPSLTDALSRARLTLDQEIAKGGTPLAALVTVRDISYPIDGFVRAFIIYHELDDDRILQTHAAILGTLQTMGFSTPSFVGGRVDFYYPSILIDSVISQLASGQARLVIDYPIKEE